MFGVLALFGRFARRFAFPRWSRQGLEVEEERPIAGMFWEVQQDVVTRSILRET